MPVRLNAPLMSFPAELLDEENPSQFHVFLKMFIVIYYHFEGGNYDAGDGVCD